MFEKKALDFLGSEEELKIIETIGNLLKIDWEDEKISKIGYLTEEIIRFNKTSETQVKELIKKWLDFLNEDEVNKLYQFLNENFLPKVRKLWQEEITETEGEKN
jgi:RNA binding exosome subunit